MTVYWLLTLLCYTYSKSDIDSQQLALQDKYEDLSLKLEQSVVAQKDLDVWYVCIYIVSMYHLLMNWYFIEVRT